MTGVTDLTFDQLHHRSRERFGFFLRKIMPRARDDAMAARTGEFRRGRAAVVGWEYPVSCSVQRDGRHRNRRLRRQPALQIGIVLLSQKVAGHRFRESIILRIHD